MLKTADAGPAALDRTTARSHTGTYHVPDDVTAMDFSLPGARLETTNVSEQGDGTHGVVRVTRITNGPGITDYVTHEKDFAYSTYGIHVGQDDRLTFFGEGQRITVHLIDCREDSPRLGDEITIHMAVSPYRVLIIPKGVAHTLDGLGGVVTRDEPVWYADRNPDWEPDNDLVSFLRTAPTAPVVRTNRHELPVSAHLLVSRMSQATNSQVRGAYASRFRVSIGGRTTYATIRPAWRAAEAESNDHAFIVRNNFVLTGPESFTVVPSTDSCTSDVLEVRLDGQDGRFTRHEYSRRRITWLAGSTDAGIEVVTEDGEHSVIRLGDPTIGVRVPPGTWYRLTGSGRIWLRSEMELLDLSPWDLAHPLGRDVTTAEPSQAGPSRPEQEADRYLPGPALHALARMEAKAISLTH
ncbi:hypothetical protein [Streptomyces sp. NBC_01264]|uniref:hypothetical protein n=1 Tax=Streptomyces sp. NBC_01264 TaxID=2903804 RepID=UPI0022561096|nr:hypothetical protein [Streptomyces sp. NBC_01264]MCX4783665.1 hypothetical protein [Streptomyces sp. NBC_01264]